jgi:hypothetical protein
VVCSTDILALLFCRPAPTHSLRTLSGFPDAACLRLLGFPASIFHLTRFYRNYKNLILFCSYGSIELSLLFPDDVAPCSGSTSTLPERLSATPACCSYAAIVDRSCFVPLCSGLRLALVSSARPCKLVLDTLKLPLFLQLSIDAPSPVSLELCPGASFDSPHPQACLLGHATSKCAAPHQATPTHVPVVTPAKLQQRRCQFMCRRPRSSAARPRSSHLFPRVLSLESLTYSQASFTAVVGYKRFIFAETRSSRPSKHPPSPSSSRVPARCRLHASASPPWFLNTS